MVVGVPRQMAVAWIIRGSDCANRLRQGLQPLGDQRRTLVEEHTSTFKNLPLHHRHIHAPNFGHRIQRSFCCDTAGFAESHKDGLHTNRLVTDMARAACYRNQQAVHAFRHEDAIRELQGLMLDKDVALTDPGMRGVVFVDAVGVKSEFGDSDAIALAFGQTSRTVESGISLGEVLLPPDAPAFAHIDVPRKTVCPV